MNEINLSALSDRELIRFVEGRELTPLEQELLRRLEEWADEVEGK